MASPPLNSDVAGNVRCGCQCERGPARPTLTIASGSRIRAASTLAPASSSASSCERLDRGESDIFRRRSMTAIISNFMTTPATR